MQQNKMTVSSIVQKLLEQGNITAEEALVLLKAEVRTTSGCPVAPLAPYHPYNPTPQPSAPPGIWYSTPITTGPTSTGGTHTHQTINDNFTGK